MQGQHGAGAALRLLSRVRSRAIALVLALALPALAHAQQQTLSPVSCTSLGGGGANWTNPGSAVSSDDGYASASVDGTVTDPLRCVNYGFAIPPTATILGIEVALERKSDRTQNNGSNDSTFFLVKAGAAAGSNRATATAYTTADAIEVHGGPADLWGTTWTPAEINAANFGAVYTGTKPDPSGQPHVITVDHMQVTVYYSVPSTPGSFNAFEPGTVAGATAGFIRTKVAGTAFSLDVVAIFSGAQLATFNNNVIVELLGNAATGVALDAQNCPTSFTVLQTVSPAAIAGGRSAVAFAAVANSWRDVRVRVRYPVGAPTVTACSTDNFAIRPASIGVSVTDSNWTSAGTTRDLTNTGAAGGVVHKAGQPFTIRVTAAPGTTTNYDGDATISALTCTLPATCANGSLTVGAFAGTGTRTSTTASYSEAGAFNLTLVDQTYAGVDSADGTPADCTASGRYVCQTAALAVGRFVPDHFAVTAVTLPVFRTFDAADAACSVPPAGPRRSFTYIGQPFGYVTSPVGTVEARNAAGNITSNYRDTLWKLTAGSVSQAFANAPALPLDSAGVLAPTLLETPNTGTGTLSANAGDKLAFTRDNAAAAAPFTANLTLSWSVSDAAEAGANQGTITTTTPLAFNGGGAGIGFDSGAEFRYGRLRLVNNHGSQLVPLPVMMEAQYWSGVGGFVTNAADHCTSIATGSIALGSYTGNLAAGETVLSGGGTLTSGRRILVLSAPGNANNGSVELTANLAASVAYLQGNWSGPAYDDNPRARATFGAFRGAGEVIFIRENF